MSEDANPSEANSQEPLFRRLLRRHVIQSAAIYVAAAWGAVEILVTLQDTLGWPRAISVWATRLFVAGFPVALIAAWRREVRSRFARFAMAAGAVAAASIALLLTFSGTDVPRAPATVVPPVNEAVATVAVLPFENSGGDPAFDYLARGFTGELIGRLSKHPDLAVIQERSVLSSARHGRLPLARAKSLGAAYFVQGQVLHDGRTFTVSAQLLDHEGNVLWSDNLREDYSASSLARMQQRISGNVSRVLGTQLQSQAYCGDTTDIGAMETYFRGRQLLGTRNPASMLEGLTLLQQAVDTDPYFGRAWSAFGLGQLTMISHYSNPNSEYHDRARAAVSRQLAMAALRRALDVCPTIGMAYKIMVPPYDGVDNDSIDQELQWRDALAMDPNDAGMLRQYFYHLMDRGMLDEALQAMRRAYEIEPLLPMIPGQYAHALSLAGRCEEALPLALEAEALGGPPSASVKLSCAILAGDAATVAAQAEALSNMGLPDLNSALELDAATLGAVLTDAAHPQRSAAAAGMVQLWNANPDFGSNPFVYALIDMATTIGELDLVFAMLDSIVDTGGFQGYTVAWSPLFAVGERSSALRTDPRFTALLSRTELPDYWREFGWPNGCAAQGGGFRCF